MKNLYAFVLNILLAFVLQLFLPWWIVVVITFGTAYLFRLKGGIGFLIGFLSIFLLWTLYSFYLSAANDHLMAGKMGELFQNIGVPMLFVLSGIIGGIFGGLGSLLGYTSYRIINKST